MMVVRKRRLAFVGQATFFESCALDEDIGGLESRFIDYREGDDPEKMLAAVEAVKPDVAFFFKPEIVPTGLLRRLPCIRVGYATEPLPSLGGYARSDLARRATSFSHLDPRNFDRMIAYNPGIAASVEEIMPVWRCVPLPVADRFYRDARHLYRRPHVIFVGRSTKHRESMLEGIKHRYDIFHIAHGVGIADLDVLADTYDIGVNLHNEQYPNFENRVCFHLAAAHLVLSEPLFPTMGLEPGIDYLEVQTASDLVGRVGEVVRSPDLYHRIRIRGRAKAELFRASSVYPSLVEDLFHDIAVFGWER